MKSSEKTAEKIAACTAADRGNGEMIQKKQTLHRLRLIRRWGINRGARVLEIGCGQGDTTAALAETVGARGFVRGIDCASPDYGSPVTLGEAAAKLAGTPLGGRIRIDLATDFLETDFLSEPPYDFAVLSHCAWYFSGETELLAYFRKLRACARRLCFAEWDALPRKKSQRAHELAAVVQAQCSACGLQTESNIRSLFTPRIFLRTAESAGWKIAKTFRVPAPDLDDAKWEIDEAFRQIADALRDGNLSEKFRALLTAEEELLRLREREGAPRCLDVFGMVCENPDPLP